MTRDEIIKRFEKGSIEHGKAISLGDSRSANLIHRKLQVLYKKANATGQSSAFCEMLNHSDETVRLWAAVFSLKHFPEMSELVLQQLTELSSITGLSADATLKLWRQGKLNLL